VEGGGGGCEGSDGGGEGFGEGKGEGAGGRGEEGGCGLWAAVVGISKDPGLERHEFKEQIHVKDERFSLL